MDVEEINLSSLDIRDNEKKRSFSNLDIDSFQLNSEKESIEEKRELRRSSRIRIRPLPLPIQEKVITRSRKLNENSSRKEIEQYYLDKRVKLSSPALETIFEEPKNNKLMSGRKLKRVIHFSGISDKPDRSKLKKRSMKAKTVVKGGIKKILKKVSLDVLMSKLNNLDD